MEALRAAALEPLLVPAIEIAPAHDLEAIDHAAGQSAHYRWVVATSANGVEAWIRAAGRAGSACETASWAVVGTATGAALARYGYQAAFVPSRSTAACLAAELPLGPGDRILVLRGQLATDALAGALRVRGAEVEDVVAYRTVEAPMSSRGLLRAALAGGPLAAVVCTSGSTVRGLHALATADGLDVRGIPAVCIGESTARVAREAGHAVVAVSAGADSTSLATCVAGAIAETGAVAP
jgi:uroporphyrinogen III methyltransferase/synthase